MAKPKNSPSRRKKQASRASADSSDPQALASPESQSDDQPTASDRSGESEPMAPGARVTRRPLLFWISLVAFVGWLIYLAYIAYVVLG